MLRACVLVLLLVTTSCMGDPELRLDDASAAEFVAVARRLLDAQRARGEEEEDLRGDDVPAVLRIDRLRYIRVHGDHVDIVFYQDPDVQGGYRVWADDATRYHEDRPTRYPGIFRYSYNDDEAESPTNLR
jgi:hypothetical protein